MGRFQQHGRRSARRSQLVDAPGVRGYQQRLGHLVGRSLRWRRDTDAVSHADGDAHSDSQAITVANSDSDCDSDAHAHAFAKPNAHAKPNAITIPVAEIFADAFADRDAITHSNSDTDTNPNADGDSDTFADRDAITVAVSDPHTDADGRRHHAPGWQCRHLLSRLAGAERRDAALSRLRQRGRTATRTRAQYLQRRD
jgi:hypothetical protein